MLALPDYVVLDFMEWISQNYPQNRIFMDCLLEDKASAELYAEKYLGEEYRNYETDDYEQCKKWLKKLWNQLIDSKEVDEILEYYCGSGACKKKADVVIDYRCIDRCYRIAEKFLHDKIEQLRFIKEYEIGEVKPYALVDSLNFYLKQNGMPNNPAILSSMVGYSSSDLTVIEDFVNWLNKLGSSCNIYKMPESVFKNVIKKYEYDRKVSLEKKTEKMLIKCFCNKSLEQIQEWIGKVWGREKGRNLKYILKRYYNDEATYKCILLPLKGESNFQKFVKTYWDDLDKASAGALDIFYSFKELNDTGFALLEKVKDLKITPREIPCIVIWQRDISTAKTISIRRLNDADLCEVLMGIISSIEKKKNLDEIYEEALRMTNDLKEQSRSVTKIVQNISGENYGMVIGSNEGIVENTMLQKYESIQKDVEQAKEKLANNKEIDSEVKKYLCELLDEAESSILRNDNRLKEGCIKQFQGLMVGVGKTASTILSVLGSFASIAGFFGISI